jgi:AraC-like DNA-binding protein
MAQPTVAAGVVKRVSQFAAEQGASSTALLASSGIDVADLDDHDNRVPLVHYIALLRAAKTSCRDPAFALHYGDCVNLAEASVVGLLGYACDTMLAAFAQLRRYSRLIMDLDFGGEDRFELVRDGEGHWIVDNRRSPNDYPELTEIAFAQMVNGTRRFGDTPLVQAVHVTHADPGYRAEYERIFAAPVTFRSGRNAMRIDSAWLGHRVEQQPRYVFGVLARHADALLAKLDSETTTRSRVESLILPILHTGSVTMQGIADSLGWSRDTLYRRLKAEGVTFAVVFDELRRRVSLDYIDAGKVSVNEAAYLVGFAEAGAFSRAFKRWTGQSPSHMRRRPPGND